LLLHDLFAQLALGRKWAPVNDAEGFFLFMVRQVIFLSDSFPLQFITGCQWESQRRAASPPLVKGAAAP